MAGTPSTFFYNIDTPSSPNPWTYFEKV